MLSFTGKAEIKLVTKAPIVNGKRVKTTIEQEELVKYYKLSKYVVSAIKDKMLTYVITPQNLFYNLDKIKALVKDKKVYTPQEQGLITLDKIEFVYNTKDEHDKKNNRKLDLDKLDCNF